ncbi:hypothetical protein DPEC_G00203440 [Dallia pectoralis]|uniref:Uncharacterized protein n=1 Tax=Dallia pectoralis TaxID=75939 RepID=A0ACC2G9K6_DALPE|nr:hypothetical protein DPEC_G00203440 [Dallia pectoralis]
MATLIGKPGLRQSVSDWDTSNKQMSDIAEHWRNISHETRQDGRVLRNETTCKTHWDEVNSSRRLSDRIWDLSRWRDTLESCAQEVDKEMDALTLGKEQTERALAATVDPLEVTVECLTLREGRFGNELVNDPVEAQLQTEVKVIDRAQRVLQQNNDKAFEQLCLLQERRQQLTLDLQNKIEAQDIDLSCLSLNVTSADISLKPNPLRIPTGSTTPQQWAQFSQFNVSRAQEDMLASLQLREEMSVTRAQLQNELEAQRIATEFAIRKRTHQLKQAHNEMLWQLKSTQDEISNMESDIRSLEDDLEAKMAPLKLVHTRLENRTKRPGVDLCKDEVQHGLVEEAKQLEANILLLKQKLAQNQHSLQVLQQHHARLGEDLSHKQDALSLEQRSLDIRSRLTSAPFTDSSLGVVVPLTNSSGRHKLELA